MDSHETAFDAEITIETQEHTQEQRYNSNQRHPASSSTAKGGVRIQSEQDAASEESSPLIARDNGDDNDISRRPSWEGADFAHLPWYRRPSLLWMIGPFFIIACAFGGYITPKLNLILELKCREYFDEQKLLQPGFTVIPVDFNGGNNDQCRIPAVQSRVAEFTLYGNLLTGLLAALTSPKLGALSDRYGRKPILILSSFGTICAELITIVAARNPETFPVPFLLLSYAVDGLTGSFIVAMSISSAYATDCTPPNMRNVAFGYFHGCLFLGIAIGPILAGYIVKLSGKIVTVFYVLAVIHMTFVLFVWFVVPESLSKRRQLKAREKHWHEAVHSTGGFDWINFLRVTDWISMFRRMNFLEPLKILHPTGPGSSRPLRRNLFALAAVDTIAFGVAMGSMTIMIIYTNYKFGWQTFESGRYMTIVSLSRVFSLLVILPIITRIVRGKPDPKKKKLGSDRLDLALIRTGIVFDTIGYLGYSLAQSEAAFILSGVVASIGAIASPTLQSALTNSVPADRTGQLLGAIGLLHALARVVAPTVFNAIYSKTVGRFTPTVFVSLTATFALAFFASCFIRPFVYLDESKEPDMDTDEPGESAEYIRSTGTNVTQGASSASEALSHAITAHTSGR